MNLLMYETNMFRAWSDCSSNPFVFYIGVMWIFQGMGGDGDPLDVIEIGEGPLPLGSIVPVEVIGIIQLLDQVWSILLAYVFWNMQ